MIFSLLIGCATTKRQIVKNTDSILSSSFFDNQFTGFLVVDTKNKDTLVNNNGAKYFTPASNTKIFTLYTALQLLPDSIPALKYIATKDTLYIEGTGDPTLLHSKFEYNKTLAFLKQSTNIAVHLNNFHTEKYGPGWSWDDYAYYYQPENGALPLYGNVATIHNTDKLHVTPNYFKDSVTVKNNAIRRELKQNSFYFSPTRKDTLETPFRTNTILTKTLLEKELGKKITLINKMPVGLKQTFYSVPTDTVYKQLMHISDNFIAEQLLLLGSSTLSDSLSGSIARNHILKNQLSDLKQPPRWVDGSGLSRYNLFTPESMVYVLSKLYTSIERERLFSFFPAGGVSGTLENWYAGNNEPYIFAKSGSLGNNYSLSGYLITKSGKTLVFSFMNNHFKHPTSEVKIQMEKVFEMIRDSY